MSGVDSKKDDLPPGMFGVGPGSALVGHPEAPHPRAHSPGAQPPGPRMVGGSFFFECAPAHNTQLSVTNACRPTQNFS